MKVIQDIAMLTFGVYPSQFPDTLIFEVIKRLNTDFGTLQLTELKHAFERLENTERRFTIMLSDFINPVRTFWNIKHKVSHERSKMQKELNEKEIVDQKENEFIEQSKVIYNESLKRGEWLGTIFNASAIAKEHVASKIDLNVKQTLYNDALNEYNEMQKDINLFMQFSGATPERLYSQNLVKFAITNEIKL